MNLQVMLARNEARSKVWAIKADALATIDALLGSDLPLAKIRAEFEAAALPYRAQSSRTSQSTGSVAVLPVHGLITRRPTLLSMIFGGVSTQKFSQQLKQAVSDPGISSILLDVDSPGGTVEGTVELADEIYKARSRKRIVASVNSTAASAAYWLASQANEIAVTPSGEVGSIGVFTVHEDISKAMDMAGLHITLIRAGKYKAEGNPWEVLGEEARQHMQAQVDFFDSMFVAAVARGRGVSTQEVNANFGQGRMVTALQAVAKGMADRVSTMDREITRSSLNSNSRGFALLRFRERELQLWKN